MENPFVNSAVIDQSNGVVRLRDLLDPESWQNFPHCNLPV